MLAQNLAEPEIEITENMVEIALSDKLDGVTNNYCLDIAGGNKDIDITKGLQAHTCYSYDGSLGTDQIFDNVQFANDTLAMPVYSVCTTLSSMEAGAKIGLAKCDGSDAQKIKLTENGTISPVSAPDMCFTAAQESRFGRAENHQLRI